MEINDLTLIYNLLYAIGEILTMTWPGRLFLGMAAVFALDRFARS